MIFCCSPDASILAVGHGAPRCHDVLHREQNEKLQSEHVTTWFFLLPEMGMNPKSFFLAGLSEFCDTIQTVSQPGRGHQIRSGFTATSATVNRQVPILKIFTHSNKAQPTFICLQPEKQCEDIIWHQMFDLGVQQSTAYRMLTSYNTV